VNGAGGTLVTPGKGSDFTQCQGVTPSDSYTTTGISWVPAATAAGVQYAVWEVTADSTVALDNLVFGVQVSFAANEAGLSGATPGAVSGSLAPISTVAQAAVADATKAPIPRFTNLNLAGTTPFSIVACVTNLLFPYITSSAGYDTGIALINTSLDNATGSTGTPANQPFNTTPQQGPCTVYFFGTVNGVVPTTVPSVTTDTVAAGTTTAFSLTQPPSGATSLANFSGYAIARCNFQYGHGLAFIVSPAGSGGGSTTYLALVIPDRSTTAGTGVRPATAFDGAGGGEQLIF
jgi:hypothetical protein